MGDEPRLRSVARIWDRAPHSAFTDLLRHRGRWWCTFREAPDHGRSIGTLRILVSDDGTAWTSAAEVVEEGIDLRDPKLSVMPDGRMLLLAGGSVFRGPTYLTRSPRVSFSEDGSTWSAPARVLAEDHWLWRVTWHDGVGYSVSKLGEASNPRRGFLYTTRDGLEWQWVTELRPPGRKLDGQRDHRAHHARRRDDRADPARLGSAAAGRPTPSGRTRTCRRVWAAPTSSASRTAICGPAPAAATPRERRSPRWPE